MKKTNLVSPLFKILLLYEDMIDENSDVTMEDYLAYLNRIGVRYLGIGEHEIYQSIKGLEALGEESNKRIVKSVVFHMISIIKRRD